MSAATYEYSLDGVCWHDAPYGKFSLVGHGAVHVRITGQEVWQARATQQEPTPAAAERQAEPFAWIIARDSDDEWDGGEPMMDKDEADDYMENQCLPGWHLEALYRAAPLPRQAAVPSTPLPGEALHGEPNWRTADISWACSFLTEATAYDGALILREWEAMKVIALAAETAALQQPVHANTDKLLSVIASAYQIAGAHDAPAHILDVLADPEQATAEQVEAMLPYQPGLVQAVPDGWISDAPILERDNRILAALRNPWGLSVETRRYARHAAADLIEERARDYRNLMDFAESQGVNCLVSNEIPTAATAPGEPGQ